MCLGPRPDSEPALNCRAHALRRDLAQLPAQLPHAGRYLVSPIHPLWWGNLARLQLQPTPTAR
jgi:hypothetical protein